MASKYSKAIHIAKAAEIIWKKMLQQTTTFANAFHDNAIEEATLSVWSSMALTSNLNYVMEPASLTLPWHNSYNTTVLADARKGR